MSSLSQSTSSSARGIGGESDRLGLLRPHVLAVGGDDVEESLRGGAEEVGQVGGVDPQAQVGGMVEGLHASHGRLLI